MKKKNKSLKKRTHRNSSNEPLALLQKKTRKHDRKTNTASDSDSEDNQPLIQLTTDPRQLRKRDRKKYKASDTDSEDNLPLIQLALDPGQDYSTDSGSVYEPNESGE